MMRLSSQTLRRYVVIVIVLLFAGGALWWGLWTLAANEFRSTIDSWIESGHAEGNVITFGDREMFGFPHHVVLRFTNLNWKNADGISFHADMMDLSSLPWEKESFDANFRGHAEINAPLEGAGQTLALAGEGGRTHVVLDPQGYWKFTRVALMKASLGRMPGNVFQADKLEATAERPARLPKNHTEPGLTLMGRAENVTIPSSMPEPFGSKMAVMDVSLRVMGSVPDFRRPASVAAWNNDSGVVEFDKLHMEWGSLNMEAKGTIGFDDDLQPEGAFASTIGNHEKVLTALMENGFIPQRQATMLNSALDVFAKPASSNASIEVPITIQLSGLYLGPVRIFVFPQIDWPKPEAPMTDIVPAPTQMPEASTGAPAATPAEAVAVPPSAPASDTAPAPAATLATTPEAAPK